MDRTRDNTRGRQEEEFSRTLESAFERPAAGHAVFGFMARLYTGRTLCIMQRRGKRRKKKLGEERISSFLYAWHFYRSFSPW